MHPLGAKISTASQTNNTKLKRKLDSEFAQPCSELAGSAGGDLLTPALVAAPLFWINPDSSYDLVIT